MRRLRRPGRPRTSFRRTSGTPAAATGGRRAPGRPEAVQQRRAGRQRSAEQRRAGRQRSAGRRLWAGGRATGGRPTARRGVRWWKVLGVAGLVGVAATGAVLARDEQRRRSYTADEIRERLHDRLAEADRTSGS